MSITFQRQWEEGSIAEGQTVTSQRRTLLYFAHVTNDETHEDVLGAAKDPLGEITPKWPPAAVPGTPTAFEEILIKSEVSVEPRTTFDDIYPVRVTYVHPASGATQFGPLEIGQERITYRSGGGGRVTKFWSDGTQRYTAKDTNDLGTAFAREAIDYDQQGRDIRGVELSTTAVQVILETAKDNSTIPNDAVNMQQWIVFVLTEVRGTINSSPIMGFPKGSLLLDTVDITPRGLPMGVAGPGVLPTEYNVTFTFIANKRVTKSYDLRADDNTLKTTTIAKEGWQYLDIKYKNKGDDAYVDANSITRPYPIQVEVHNVIKYSDFGLDLAIDGAP